MYRVYKYNDKTGKYEKYKDVTSAKCTVSGLSANTKYKFKMLHIGRSTALSLLRSGKIKSIKIGRAYRIPKVYVIEYLNNSTNT